MGVINLIFQIRFSTKKSYNLNELKPKVQIEKVKSEQVKFIISDHWSLMKEFTIQSIAVTVKAFLVQPQIKLVDFRKWRMFKILSRNPEHPWSLKSDIKMKVDYSRWRQSFTIILWRCKSSKKESGPKDL